MQQYNVKCPKCGAENKSLFLEETNGWFICDQCGKQVQEPGFEKIYKIPILKGKQLTKLFVAK